MWDPLLETFVRANSVGAFGFQLQGPLARVFPGPSDFTVPVYRLSNAGGGDWVFIVSTDGTAPSRGGYSVDGIFAYVYSTPICESVPLYSVFNPGLVDHWYTTDVNGYNYMLELSEWVDEGIMGYVLPLGTVTNIYFSRASLLNFYQDCESCSS